MHRQRGGGSTEGDYVESTTTSPRGCGTLPMCYTSMLSKGSSIAQHDSDDDSLQSTGMGIVGGISADNRGYR